MNWKELFDKAWGHYKPPANDPLKAGVWSGGDYEQMKEFIKTEVIEKLIDEIPSRYTGTGRVSTELTSLKQQLRDKWLS